MLEMRHEATTRGTKRGPEGYLIISYSIIVVAIMLVEISVGEEVVGVDLKTGFHSTVLRSSVLLC